MPTSGPTSLQVRPVNPVLTGLMSLHAQSQTQFIADQAFPPTYRPGEHSGTFLRAHTDWGSFGLHDIHRAPNSEYRSGGFGLTNAAYTAIEFGFEVGVDRSLAAGSQTSITLERLAGIRALAEVMIARERRVRDAMFVTGIWTSEATLGAAAQWDDAAGAPLVNIWTRLEAIMTQTKGAKKANGAVMGQGAFRVLIQNNDFTNLIPQAQSTSMLSESQLEAVLAAHFNLKRVFVGRSVEQTANEAAAEVEAFIWGDNCWLGYLPQLDPEGAQQLGAFGQIASTDGGAPTVTEMYYEEKVRSDVVRVREQRAEPVYDADAAGLILDCAN